MSGSLGRQARRVLGRVLRQFVRDQQHKGGWGGGRGRSRGRVNFPFTAPKPSAYAQEGAREYKMPPGGLPPLEYSPRNDGLADPGEVVWAWVPYEDDPSRGKDRPVLIVSEVTGGFLGLQMTSKDHSRDAEREAAFGRHWIDVGNGAWDSQRRDSQVRLDRPLFLPPQVVRREGASLPRDQYLRVVEALERLHR